MKKARTNRERMAAGRAPKRTQTAAAVECHHQRNRQQAQNSLAELA